MTTSNLPFSFSDRSFLIVGQINTAIKNDKHFFLSQMEIFLSTEEYYGIFCSNLFEGEDHKSINNFQKSNPLPFNVENTKKLNKTSLCHQHDFSTFKLLRFAPE